MVTPFDLKIKELEEELEDLTVKITTLKIKREQFSDKYDKLAVVFDKWINKIKPLQKILVLNGKLYNGRYDTIPMKLSLKSHNYGIIIYPQPHAHYDPRDYGRGYVKLNSLENYFKTDSRSHPITFTSDNKADLIIDEINLLRHVVNYKLLVFNPEVRQYEFYKQP